MLQRCHLSKVPYEQAEKYGKRTVFMYQDFGSDVWKEMPWTDFAASVKVISNALLNMNVAVQENIGIFSQNCVPYICTDFGAYGIRACTVPFYATSSEEQIQYVINDAQIRILFVGEQQQYDKACRAQSLCPTLERIIAYDPAVVFAEHDNSSMHFDDFLRLGEGCPRQSELDVRLSESNETDLANILYTSGTSGEPKGVMLPYSQYHAAFIANDVVVPVTENDRIITFLPITHIFERGWDWLCLCEGCTLIVNTNPHNIQRSMRQTHPTCMASVPRFWEKVYAGVQETIDNSGPFKQKVFRNALKIGYKYNVECKAQGKQPSVSLAMKYNLIDKTILSLVRKHLGLENANLFPTAGARVSPEVETFVHSIGLDMIVGYGLTESLATVSCNHKGEPFTVGGVGMPIPGIDVKIDSNGEVLLKGPTITPGYYNRPSINEKTFTEDGYFRTGDAGYMKNGELFLTERIKDLFKTSNGKYVAPQAVEARLLVDKYVEQVVIIADERKYVTALIVPNYATLEEWARSNGIKVTNRKQLCEDEQVNKMLADHIDTLQQGLAAYEQIKRFTLLPTPFSAETGELTNTLKTRRNVIYKRYAALIEKMYKE